MRRIFPLKSASASNYGASGDITSKENSRQKISSSRDMLEPSKRVVFNGGKAGACLFEDADSTSSRLKREHWCPSCAGLAKDLRCGTPPSGDENFGAGEEEKSIISPIKEPVEVMRRDTIILDDDVKDIQANLALDDAFKNFIVVLKGSRNVSSGDNLLSATKSSTGTFDGPEERTPMHSSDSKRLQVNARPTSAPKVRPTLKSLQSDSLRPHSMRLPSVPDRVFDTLCDSGDYDATSGGVKNTARTRIPLDRARFGSAPSSRSHSRSSSLSDSVGASVSGRPLERPPINPSNLRKVVDFHGIRKDPCLPVLVGASERKQSGARTVAERLAKAFRGSNKSICKESTASRDSSPSQSAKVTSGGMRRHTFDHRADRNLDARVRIKSNQAADENVALLNVLPLVKPCELSSVGLQRDAPVMTWQDFVSGSQNLLEGKAGSASGDKNQFTEVKTISDSATGGTNEFSDLKNNPDSQVESKRWESVNNEDMKSRHTCIKPQEEKEREILKAWLEGLKQQSENSGEDLEGKAKAAQERISVLDGELTFLNEQVEFLNEHPSKDDENCSSDLTTGLNIMQQRIKRMHDDKKRLALEVASEVKRRITERAAAKEVLIMMKREMEACVKVMEKEKLEVQRRLERELDRREKDWCSKLEKIRSEETRLRERVLSLEEEKNGLQRELTSVAAKENTLREKDILGMGEKGFLFSNADGKENEQATRHTQQSQADIRDSLQVSARQLYLVNERVEHMSDKLSERESDLLAVKKDNWKKDEVIRGLEQSLGDMAKTVDAQNRRIMHLSSRNEELFKLYHAKGKEVDELHSRIVEEAESRKRSKEDLEELAEQARECKQELEAQDMHCRLLREKLVQREGELQSRNDEVATFLQRQDWLQTEMKKFQAMLAEANSRIVGLEKNLREKEELISTLKKDTAEPWKELMKLREELPKVKLERDELHDEAEEMGREALRLSAEVEVLRRKVVQLDEDVMFKEGQISILRGSCFTGND